MGQHYNDYGWVSWFGGTGDGGGHATDAAGPDEAVVDDPRLGSVEERKGGDDTLPNANRTSKRSSV